MWGIQISRCIIYQYYNILYCIRLRNHDSSIPQRIFTFQGPSPRWQLPPLRWGRRMYLPREVLGWAEGFPFQEWEKNPMNHEILDIFHVTGFHLDASPSFLMDSFQQNLPSAQQKKHATYRLTQYVLTGWSPWYDGPCTDDTGSWLQPSSVIMAIPNTWDRTAELHVCRSQDYWMQQMKPCQLVACLFFLKKKKQEFKHPVARKPPTLTRHLSGWP